MTPTRSSDEARVAEKHARFMALLTPSLAKLSRYCHAMTKDVEDGRDLLGDAILLAYEHFDALRVPEAFTSYIFTTARRLHYRRARKKKVWTPLGETSNEIPDERGAPPEVKLDLEALDRALQELPEQQREAVILFEISELSIREIREVQGGTISGVKSRIVRGREKLAELLGERGRIEESGGQQTAKAAGRNTSFHRNGSIALIQEKP